MNSESKYHNWIVKYDSNFGWNLAQTSLISWEGACVWWQSSSVAANPVARGTELAISLRVKDGFSSPALSPPLLPLPHPCGKRTLGSAGPAEKLLPVRAAVGAVLNLLPSTGGSSSSSETVLLLLPLPRVPRKHGEERKERKGGKKREEKRGEGNRNGGGEEGGKTKEKLPKERTFGGFERGRDYLHWVLISRAPTHTACAYSTLCSQPLPCNRGRKSLEYEHPSWLASRSACLSPIRRFPVTS